MKNYWKNKIVLTAMAIAAMSCTRQSAKPGPAPMNMSDISSSARSVQSSVKAPQPIVLPVETTMPLTIEARGTILADPRSQKDVTSLIAGRIEHLYVKSPSQSVRQGQTLMDIYSPELLAAQQDYLYLLKVRPKEDVTAESRKRLILLGISETHIKQIEAIGKPQKTFSLTAPVSGYIVESQEENRLREGMYIESTQALLRIQPQNAWFAEVDVYPGSAGQVREGMKAEVFTVSGTHLGSGSAQATTRLLEASAFQRVRVPITSNQNVQPGQLVVVKFTIDVKGMWIPTESVVRLGQHEVVFVRRRGTFRPVEVVTGASGSGRTQILKGITSSDSLAAKAAFLVDSENIIPTQND